MAASSTRMIDRIYGRRVLSHLLFWFILFVVFSMPHSLVKGDFDYSLSNLFLLPATVPAAYLLVYFQVPKFIYNRRFVAFFLSLILSGYVFAVIARICIVHGFEPFVVEGEFDQESIWEIMTDFKALFFRYFSVAYTMAIMMLIAKMIKTNFEQRHQSERLKSEKQRAELNFLKAQIHPHFLFNTLNNLYALTLKNSEHAPETVLKLADMLDYMLYQCDVESVPIEKELALLDNYIALEKLRYGDRLAFSFEKEIDDLNCPIAPLILLSVVENAFKHGASGDAAEPHIEMNVRLQNNHLYFRVFNSKPLAPNAEEQESKKGIGTNNVRRQLELVYADRFTVETTDLKESYETILNIDLTAK